MIARWLAGSTVRMLIAAVLVLVLALAAVSRLAVAVNERHLAPELTLKALTVTESVRRQVERALAHGVPLDGLAGMEAYFAHLAEQDAEIAFLAVAAEGRLLLSEGLNGPAAEALTPALLRPPQGATTEQSLEEGRLVTRAALQRDGAAVGTLVIGHDHAQLMQPVTSNLADILVVLVVASLLAFELLLLVVALNVSLPLRHAAEQLRGMARHRYRLVAGVLPRDELGRLGRRLDRLVTRRAVADPAAGTPGRVVETRLIGVRLLAFLFVFAEELARPFLPLYLRDASAEGFGLGFSDDLRIGIIMSAQLVTVAVCMPLASLFYDRFGRRRLYLLGALLSTLGLLGTGLGEGLPVLLAARVVSAVGYAMMFVACQGFVLEATNSANRAQGSAMMVGGIMLADICGPAIGGILASHIGFAQTFLLGAAVAATAGLLLPLLMGGARDHVEAPAKITLAGFRETFRNGRFRALLFFAAVPAKLALSGYLYVLVPLALLQIGVSVADVGRVMLLYGLAAVFFASLFARLADRSGRHREVVALGGAVAGLGMVPILAGQDFLAVLLGVVALGIGQAMSISPQLALATRLGAAEIERHGQGVVMASLRLVERLGGACGPLVAVTLMGLLGLEGAMGVFGLYLLVSATLLLLSLRGLPTPRRGSS